MEGLRSKKLEGIREFDPNFSIEEKPSIEDIINNWTPEQLKESLRVSQEKKKRREENLRGLRQACEDLVNLLNK